MAAVVPVRRALRVRTAFNILGPLLNPAGAAYGLIGVYSTAIAPLMASTLQRLGCKRALVVHSHGLDELTPLGDAEVLEVTPSGTRSYRLARRTPCSHATSRALPGLPRGAQLAQAGVAACASVLRCKQRPEKCTGAVHPAGLCMDRLSKALGGGAWTGLV